MARGGMKVPEEDIIRAFKESEDPVLGAEEVGDIVGITRQGAGRRLRELVKEGKLMRKKPGARTAVYWLPSDED
jgi:Fic family protein